jgi:hypothetical protein
MYVEKKVTIMQRKFLFKFQITYKKRTSEQYVILFTLFLRILYIFRLCTVGEVFNFLCKRSRILIWCLISELNHGLLIRQFNWEESFFTLVNDIDEMADFFTNKYLEMAKECIPTKVVNIRRTDKPSITHYFFYKWPKRFWVIEFSSKKPLAFK